MTENPLTENPLWPDHDSPADLAAIEAMPLDERGLPGSTYTLLARAATRWPDRTAITVLPEAARWREPVRRARSILACTCPTRCGPRGVTSVRRGRPETNVVNRSPEPPSETTTGRSSAVSAVSASRRRISSASFRASVTVAIAMSSARFTVAECAYFNVTCRYTEWRP